MYLVVEGISIPIVMLSLSSLTIPHWMFMIFNIDMICPIIQRQRYYETHRTRYNHRLRAII
jgi:hypothetical protein